MRIISGFYKGRRINAPKNLPVRPTTDRAKEALFNILENRYDLNEKKILDLFSGTGNISFEFSSRYSTSITSIDKNIQCINFIEKISNEYQFNIKTIQSDSLRFVRTTQDKFDIIFADPPYNFLNYQKLKNLIVEKKLVKENGCLIFEHDKNTSFEGENIELRKYGTVHFSIFLF